MIIVEEVVSSMGEHRLCVLCGHLGNVKVPYWDSSHLRKAQAWMCMACFNNRQVQGLL